MKDKTRVLQREGYAYKWQRLIFTSIFPSYIWKTMGIITSENAITRTVYLTTQYVK
jgi:hypothetical protein